MKRISGALSILLITLALLPIAAASETRATRATGADINAVVIAPPSLVAATDGRGHLAYEMVVHNRSSSRVRLNQVDVRNTTDRTVLQRLRGGRLKNRTFSYGEDGVRANRNIRPGNFVVLLLDVRISENEPGPPASDIGST